MPYSAFCRAIARFEATKPETRPDQALLEDLPRFKKYHDWHSLSSDLVSCVASGTPTMDAFEWLLENHSFMSVSEWTEVLAELFLCSGAYIGLTKELYDPRIEALFSHFCDQICGEAEVEIKKAMRDYRDPNGCTIMHKVFYGHGEPSQKATWASTLAMWGVDPFAPHHDGQTAFHLMATGLHLDMVTRFLPRLPIFFDMGAPFMEFDKGRSLPMRLLYSHAKEKNLDRLERLKAIFQLLIGHPSFMSKEVHAKSDDDGLKLADYLEFYNWADVLHPSTEGWDAPTGLVPQASAQIYKNHSDHPVVTWCFRHRYHHVFDDALVKELEDIVRDCGLPDHDARTNKDGKEIETFSQQCHQWGYHYSPLASLLGFDTSSA